MLEHEKHIDAIVIELHKLPNPQQKSKRHPAERETITIQLPFSPLSFLPTSRIINESLKPLHAAPRNGIPSHLRPRQLLPCSLPPYQPALNYQNVPSTPNLRIPRDRPHRRKRLRHHRHKRHLPTLSSLPSPPPPPPTPNPTTPPSNPPPSQKQRALCPPSIRARFNALHEGARPFQTREMRIWKTNAFLFDPVKDRNPLSAIFLDLSRINHSCLPNAEYHANFQKERMELYSTKGIEKGEEVTICYGEDFMYKTGEERNAYLRYVYGFSCKCRACADPGFREVSDRRRRMLKQGWYCGMSGMPVAPDFSAKALGIDGPSSARPIRAQKVYRVVSVPEVVSLKTVPLPCTPRRKLSRKGSRRCLARVPHIEVSLHSCY